MPYRRHKGCGTGRPRVWRWPPTSSRPHLCSWIGARRAWIWRGPREVAQKKHFSGDPGGLIGDAIFSAIKPLYKEGKRQERAARARGRTYYAPEPKVYIKDIVFEVLPHAIQNAGANFSARDLYYATRPLCYAHDEWEDGKRLGYGYFSQTLLTEYQDERGLI